MAAASGALWSVSRARTERTTSSTSGPDQIGQVHMRDLFEEEYPWRRLITSLVEMKFGGYCFAEIPESTDGVRVLKYFRGMFRAYQNL